MSYRHAKMRATIPERRLSLFVGSAFVFLMAALGGADPARAQDGHIRARIDAASTTTFRVDAGRKDGLDEEDVVDAFSDSAYVGSLRVVDVTDATAVLTFLEDDILGQQVDRRAIGPGDYLFLRLTPADDRLAKPPRAIFPPNFDLDVQVASVYDSNIDHNDEPLESYGVVPAARIRLRSHVDKPLFVASYAVARHDYTNTDRWSRTSHLATLEFEPRPADWFRMATAGQISIRGSSEDRDIADQFRVEQDLEFLFTRQLRLIVYGGLVWKRFPESPIDNAFKPRVGAAFRSYGDSGRRWELDVRREWNEEEELRGEYDRWKVESSYRFPVTSTVRAEAEIEFRRKVYRDRFVEIEEEDYLRRDHRWTLVASAAKTLHRRVSIELSYTFEMRESNDPDKFYDAHLITLALGYRLLPGR